MLNHVAIYGERNSGTNWLEELISKNFIGPFSSPERPSKSHWFIDGDINISQHENTLFIVIFRNVYDWLQSMCIKPYHTEEGTNAVELNTKEFSKFIRCGWSSQPGGVSGRNVGMSLEESKNIITLRNDKNRDWLSLRKLTNNVLYINYEDLYDNTIDVLNRFEEKGLIKKNSVYDMCDKRPEMSVYPEISMDDIEFIKNNLDLDLERIIGYEINKLV